MGKNKAFTKKSGWSQAWEEARTDLTADQITKEFKDETYRNYVCNTSKSNLTRPEQKNRRAFMTKASVS